MLVARGRGSGRLKNGRSFHRGSDPSSDHRRLRASSPSLGRPNVRKSTLVNALVGIKVTIGQPQGADHARDHPRHCDRWGDAQLIFVDTPGISPRVRRLDRAMWAMAWSGAHDADIVALMVAPSAARTMKPRRSGQGSRICGATKILIVNKGRSRCQAGPARSRPCEAMNAWRRRGFMISAQMRRRRRRAEGGEVRRNTWIIESRFRTALCGRSGGEITREKNLSAAAPGLPISGSTVRDRWCGRSCVTARCVYRADHLCRRARASARLRWASDSHQGDRAAGAQGNRDLIESRFMYPVRRCARDGPMNPSDYREWGWNSRGIDARHSGRERRSRAWNP